MKLWVCLGGLACCLFGTVAMGNQASASVWRCGNLYTNQPKPDQYCESVSIRTLEETQVVVLPRAAIEWGYSNLKEGEKMGRLVAEYYYIYQDDRIKNNYVRTPKQRYDSISEVFPNIHNRVPQHMIASYLGISPIHLSRLKKI